MTTLEAGLFDSGRPVLIAPPSPQPQMGTNVLIAWNGSTEQARVTAFALPILKRANRVIVLTVEGGAAVPGPTGQQLRRYLQLNEVPAKPLTVGLDGGLTGEVILAHAKALGCDLLIKGAYTQSRLRQMIFGGTTRYILSNAELPVLMAHRPRCRWDRANASPGVAGRGAPSDDGRMLRERQGARVVIRNWKE
jgi:nucleotide-binding universal stress UspA family protein